MKRTGDDNSNERFWTTLRVILRLRKFARSCRFFRWHSRKYQTSLCFCNVAELRHISQRKNSRVSRFLAKSSDSRNNFVYLPKQALSEFRFPVNAQHILSYSDLNILTWRPQQSYCPGKETNFDSFFSLIPDRYLSLCFCWDCSKNPQRRYNLKKNI